MSKPWQGQAVIIIDDSPGVRETLKSVFEAVGMRVAGLAKDGVEGLALIEKTNPDLVSLDLIMPEMDGVECYRKIVAARPQQRIVVVSWLGAEQKILENLVNTIPQHLFQAKPLTPELLSSRLDRVYGLVAGGPATQPQSSKPDKLDDLDDLDSLQDLGVKVS